MNNYSRKMLKIRRILPFFIVIFILVLIASISYIVYINSNNYITYSNVDNSAAHVSDNIAKESTPIIINNAIIGGTYDTNWVDKSRYINLSENKVGIDIDMYKEDAKYGEYKIDEINFSNNANYVKTSKGLILEEYYAIAKGKGSSNGSIEIKEFSNEFDEYVKKALGKYTLLNSSINVISVYSVSDGYIIAATSKVNTNSAYSCIVYVENGNSKLVKYNYVNDKNDSEDFGILIPKFVVDFNNDGSNDIVIQETKEFETNYIIIDKKDGKFKEVLSTTIK